ncbi:MAG TPA: hypothetical protein VLB46_09200 [Pyrinomonadaceae bacterium]|nr:hypothetical protein [Pyrinomonadaceae bacterium]
MANFSPVELTPQALANFSPVELTPQALANFSPVELTPQALANFSPVELTPRALANFSPVELTPKALANFSPGFERSENPGGSKFIAVVTLKGFANCRTLSGFMALFDLLTQGCRCAPTLG